MGGHTVKTGLVFPRVNLPVVIILHASQLFNWDCSAQKHATVCVGMSVLLEVCRALLEV